MTTRYIIVTEWVEGEKASNLETKTPEGKACLATLQVQTDSNIKRNHLHRQESVAWTSLGLGCPILEQLAIGHMFACARGGVCDLLPKG